MFNSLFIAFTGSNLIIVSNMCTFFPLNSPGGSSDEETDSQKDSSKSDKHSTNTWPPKQTWSQTAQGVNPHPQPPEKVPVHRPVSMQWSDPLANRSPWSG